MFVEKVVTGPDGDKLGFGVWSGVKTPAGDHPGGYNAGVVLRADPDAPAGVVRLYSIMLYEHGNGHPAGTVFVAADQSRQPGSLRFAEPDGTPWRKPLARHDSPLWFGEPSALSRFASLPAADFAAAGKDVAAGKPDAAVEFVRKLAGDSGLPSEFVRKLRTFLADLT